MKKRTGILIIALLCAGCNYPELSEDEIGEFWCGDVNPARVAKTFANTKRMLYLCRVKQ